MSWKIHLKEKPKWYQALIYKYERMTKISLPNAHFSMNISHGLTWMCSIPCTVYSVIRYSNMNKQMMYSHVQLAFQTTWWLKNFEKWNWPKKKKLGKTHYWVKWKASSSLDSQLRMDYSSCHRIPNYSVVVGITHYKVPRAEP